MLPFQSFYGLGSRSDQSATATSFRGFPSFLIPADENSELSTGQRKTTEACRSHKEAERRRRQRINAHLSTLRTLLPNPTKTDKASLLAEVVHHVKELRRQAAEIARRDGEPCCRGVGPEAETSWPFPGESDEATLSCSDGEVKATLCCEDRPGLNRDLVRAIRSVRARAVRAEITTLGGRTKSVVVIRWAAAGGGGPEEIGALKRALNAIVENRSSGFGPENKRARFCPTVADVGSDFMMVNGESLDGTTSFGY